MGTTNTIQTTNLQVKDSLITLNRGGADSSAGGAGIEFEEKDSPTGWIKLSLDRSSYDVKMPANSSIYTMAVKDSIGNISGNASSATALYITSQLGTEYPSTGSAATDWRIVFTNASDDAISKNYDLRIRKNGLKYNPNTDTLSCANFSGSLSGSSTSCTGNATSATKLQTARAITLTGNVTGAANFDGSAGIEINTTCSTATTCTGNANTATSAGTCTGNANTASNLYNANTGTNQNARHDGGASSVVARDGSGDIRCSTLYGNATSSNTAFKIEQGPASVKCDVNGSVYMSAGFIYSYSRFGIGANPNYWLHVEGANPSSSTTWTTARNYSNSDIYNDSGRPHGNVKIYTDGRVAGEGLVAFSDERIKKNIQDIDDGYALETLRLIQPKRYNYIDTIMKGTEPVWGFIAQQIREVLPYSTTLLTDYIPNVFCMATVSNTNVLTLINNGSTSKLNANANGKPVLIRLYIQEDNKENKKNVTIKTIVDDTTIIIEESLDADVSTVFVYGQEVDDFHSLNKDAIYAVAVAAVQEVDRSVEILKTENANLKKNVSDLTTRLEKLEKIISTLNL